MDLYATVTDAIVRQIENDPGDWIKPWRSATANGLPANATTGREYTGVNVLQLWASGAAAAYNSPLWATYKQWSAIGAQVRKGERGTMIVYAGQGIAKPKDGENEDQARRFNFLKPSWVFNAAQVDGYVAPQAAPRDSLVNRIERADAFIAGSSAIVRHGGGRAFYAPGPDVITIPEQSDFNDTATASATENYYSTLAHELVHWTGHAKRCNRQFGKRFGDDAYAAEELVAEIGASFLCAMLQIENEPRLDHAQYLSHWLAILKKDKKAIFTAASKASAAVDYLKNFEQQKIAA